MIFWSQLLPHDSEGRVQLDPANYMLRTVGPFLARKEQITITGLLRLLCMAVTSECRVRMQASFTSAADIYLVKAAACVNAGEEVQTSGPGQSHR